ncbi:phage tail assembly chaperone [Rhizobium rhizogenes]|uniref:phage tail assembly chaperone n=1 Tax=Rhizobium rhizogenes TaxID=359 RepID=UPI00403FAEA3
MPAAGAHVWAWFRELDRARTSNGYGLNPLSYSDIDAWSRLRRISLLAWHLDALISMDGQRLHLLYEKTASETEEKPTVSERPLTARLFDALFPAKTKRK